MSSRDKSTFSTTTEPKPAKPADKKEEKAKVWKVDKLEDACPVCAGTIFDAEGCRRCRSNSFELDGSKKKPLKIPESPL